jgi:indole-3-glycerol phosphate synthase
MNRLEEIVAYKVKETEDRKSLYPTKLLEKSLFYNSPCVSLKKYLLRNDLNGIIAEFKRKSPSKGIINPYAKVEETTIGYMQAGASALSILTDQHFFGGSNDDLVNARKANFCPILRKEFIIDEYQIIEAKSIGSDAILLIAAILNKEKIKKFGDLAISLEMEVLLEIHNEEELDNYINNQFIVGYNSRNLKTMHVDLNSSFTIIDKLPPSAVKVAESGIKNPETVNKLKHAGYNGFLIGENFMTHARPELACKSFIQKIISTAVSYEN